MWFDKAYLGEDWSIHRRMNEVDTKLTAVRFPSTTTRRPRSIFKHTKYKGNELRSLLLFAHRVFEGVLQNEYCDHFFLLVLIMHLAEARSLHRDWIETLQELCTQFVLTFPRLYSARHNVQVIHSVIHIGDTVKGYGPLCTFSTFNFESLLGMSPCWIPCIQSSLCLF